MGQEFRPALFQIDSGVLVFLVFPGYRVGQMVNVAEVFVVRKLHAGFGIGVARRANFDLVRQVQALVPNVVFIALLLDFDKREDLVGDKLLVFITDSDFGQGRINMDVASGRISELSFHFSTFPLFRFYSVPGLRTLVIYERIDEVKHEFPDLGFRTGTGPDQTLTATISGRIRRLFPKGDLAVLVNTDKLARGNGFGDHARRAADDKNQGRFAVRRFIQDYTGGDCGIRARKGDLAVRFQLTAVILLTGIVVARLEGFSVDLLFTSHFSIPPFQIFSRPFTGVPAWRNTGRGRALETALIASAFDAVGFAFWYFATSLSKSVGRPRFWSFRQPFGLRPPAYSRIPGRRIGRSAASLPAFASMFARFIACSWAVPGMAVNFAVFSFQAAREV